MLPNEAASESVYLEGPGSIIKNAKKDAILIESSTISPELAIKISQEAEKEGVIAVDAPVSGAQIGAISGTLTFMVGAKQEATFNTLRPFLEAMGKTIIYCGKNGAGEAMKVSEGGANHPAVQQLHFRGDSGGRGGGLQHVGEERNGFESDAEADGDQLQRLIHYSEICARAWTGGRRAEQPRLRRRLRDYPYVEGCEIGNCGC